MELDEDMVERNIQQENLTASEDKTERGNHDPMNVVADKALEEAKSCLPMKNFSIFVKIVWDFQW